MSNVKEKDNKSFFSMRESLMNEYNRNYIWIIGILWIYGRILSWSVEQKISSCEIKGKYQRSYVIIRISKLYINEKLCSFVLICFYIYTFLCIFIYLCVFYTHCTFTVIKIFLTSWLVFFIGFDSYEKNTWKRTWWICKVSSQERY